MNFLLELRFFILSHPVTSKQPHKIVQIHMRHTGESLSEALIFAEHGENMLCTQIVLNVKNNFCTQHVLPMF